MERSRDYSSSSVNEGRNYQANNPRRILNLSPSFSRRCNGKASSGKHDEFIFIGAVGLPIFSRINRIRSLSRVASLRKLSSLWKSSNYFWSWGRDSWRKSRRDTRRGAQENIQTSLFAPIEVVGLRFNITVAIGRLYTREYISWIKSSRVKDQIYMINTREKR